MDLTRWLRDQLDDWTFDAAAILLRTPTLAEMRIEANGIDELLDQLADADALAPLPEESAALANVVEQSLLLFLRTRLDRLAEEDDADVQHASAGARGYPDLEVSGGHFAPSDVPENVPVHIAVDVKVARRNKSGSATENAITLYTGNTYFKYPDLPWPGTIRPFGDYVRHLDVVILYDFRPELPGRVTNVGVVVHESWRLASKTRSSGTREYIGAVKSIERLREGKGEFGSRDEFYDYWWKFPFKTSPKVTDTLYRLMQRANKQGG